MPRLLLLVLLAAFLAPAPAVAQEREPSYEHTGSVGGTVSLGAELVALQRPSCATCAEAASFSALTPFIDLGGTLAVGAGGNELALKLRLHRFTEAAGESLFFGFRTYFGKDRFKTLFAGDLQVSFRPLLALGGRVAVGALYELSPVLAMYSEGGVEFGIGSGKRFGGEVLIGIQGRSYLFE